MIIILLNHLVIHLPQRLANVALSISFEKINVAINVAIGEKEADVFLLLIFT